MNPQKVKILQEEDEMFWNDFWLDLDSINGFYIVADEEEVQGEYIRLIVVYVNGENFTLKPEKHLEKYLLKRFVTPEKAT